jgi:hypothetical protein
MSHGISARHEDKRSLIPENVSVLNKIEYIRKNAALLGVSLIGSKGSGIPPNENDPPVNDEMKLVKEIENLMAKPNKTPQEEDLLWEKSKKLKELRAAKGGK